MVLIAKSGTPSLSSVVPPQNCVIGSGLLAGEDIEAGDICYIKSDGKVWRSNGTSATAPAAVDGIAPRAAKSGEAVSVYRNVEMRYGSGLTPGTRLYAGATAGRIDAAATTGGTESCGFVVDATRVFIHGSAY